jgi:hypothetical protein
MARKFSNRSYLIARLGSTRLFWRVRYGLSWLDFRRLRVGFQVKNGVSTANSEVRYWRAMTKGSVIPIILALIVSIALYLFEQNIPYFNGLTWVHDSFIGQYLSHTLDNNSYVQMLTVIAGVTGVFLGLYFTAVSTVISNAYSSVSGDVRELILKDRLGNNYVKLVAFLTALSVLLLSFSAANTAPLHLAIPLLALVSCLAIFAFVKLGSRTFFLSDPTLFFHTLSDELIKCVKQATYRGYQWRNPSFQEHYRKQALRSVTTLATLVEMSGSKAELQNKSHPRLLNNLLALTSIYYDEKHLIRSDSQWYGKKFQHKQWYLTESTAVEMATTTDTTLQPAEVPNDTWLEDIILTVIFNAFKSDAEAGDYQALYNKIAGLTNFFSGIGGNWLAQDGEKWHDKLSKDILGKLVKDNTLDETQEPYSIAVVDILASLPMSLELGFIKAINSLDGDKLRNKLNRTKWSHEFAVYQFPLPSNAIKVLEQTYRGIDFERQAHAPHKTPNWYVTELTLHELDLAIHKQWQSHMKLLETWYPQAGNALSDAKKYKQSATIYSRAIELAWKLDSHIEHLKELSEALNKDGRVDFIQKADWDWDKEHERVKKFRDTAIDGQAKLIPHLWDTKQPDPDMPDFFGGAVHRTGEACYEALVAGDTERFKVLFRPYFLGILGIFDSIRPQVVDWETSSAIAWMSEPVLDLFDISGYAYIYAEYHNKPELWSECKAIWDSSLTSMPQQLQSFAVISNYHQTPRGVITPRATLRSRWQMELGRQLNSLPRQGGNDFYSRPAVEHQSKLIKRIAPWDSKMPFMHVDAIDVFTVRYLLTAPTKLTLDFGVRQHKLDGVNGRQGDKDA